MTTGLIIAAIAYAVVGLLMAEAGGRVAERDAEAAGTPITWPMLLVGKLAITALWPLILVVAIVQAATGGGS